MLKLKRLVFLCNRYKYTHSGLTLVELLVTLLVLSILAGIALPYAEVTIQRNKEWELRRALREVRTAIDQFHADWKLGKIPMNGDIVSQDGYPKTLSILIDGAEGATVSGSKRKYLRRIPSDPFADAQIPLEDQWQLRSYQDESDALTWGGQDVYNISSKSKRKAINGGYYYQW